MSVQTGPSHRGVDCRIFGSVSVTRAGSAVHLGGPKQRLVLAVLLARANAVVTVDSLIDALWTGVPPRTARKSVQVYVSQLRKIFGERLTRSGRGLGYSLRLAPEECDAVRFGQLTEAGRNALRDGDRTLAAELLGRGIRLWSGQPFAEFGYQPCLAEEVDRLVERFLAALEDWAGLEIDRGSYGEVLERLDRTAPRHPLRERLAAARMRALAATGRSGEALAHFEFVRRELARELGTDPGRSLAEIHRRLLRGEDVSGPPPTAPAAPALLNQLPRDLADFVGRDAEIDRVAELFSAERGYDTVVVSGQVGIGKTAFAVHLANRLAPCFPDGRILVELAEPDGTPKSRGAVLDELLRLAGIAADPARTAAHALALWRSWVAERRLLLILDGATGEAVVSELLPGSGPNRVIVTSRARLSGLAAVAWIELPVLAMAEGRELLGRIAGPARLLADRRSTQEILLRCDRVPLAVRIAGARLAALRHVRPADFAARLRTAPAMLDELGVGHLDVRSRYESFYRTLTATQQFAYRRLAGLSWPAFDHDRALAAVAGPEGPAVRTIESLLECGLLTVAEDEVGAVGTCYEMPRLAHLFGRELRSDWTGAGEGWRSA